MNVSITNLGPARDVLRPATADVKTIWSGKISLGKSQQERAQATARLEAALPKLDGYYVPADLTAPTRCIDGRVVEGYREKAALQARGLGPQVAGGTPAGALVHRVMLLDDRNGSSEAFSFEQDIAYIISQFGAHGIGFGGHIDEDHSGRAEDTGCGAIDKMPLILKKMVAPEAWIQLHAMASSLLGDAYDETMVNQISGRLLHLESVAQEYLHYNAETGRYGYKQQVMKVMRDLAQEGRQPVERLMGPHCEKAIVVNMVPGTTFDRDRFSNDNNNEMQLFSWDLWRSRQTAEILYPVDMTAEYLASRKMLYRRYEYVLCRTLYTLATAMVLTDGSLPVLLRK